MVEDKRICVDSKIIVISKAVKLDLYQGSFEQWLNNIHFSHICINYAFGFDCYRKNGNGESLYNFNYIGNKNN